MESRQKNVLWHGHCGPKARIKVLGICACVHRMQNAADEDVSEIPTLLWGRFLVQGFSLGIHSPDHKHDFQRFSPLQTQAELSMQTPGLGLQLLEPLRKRNLHPWFPIGSIGVKLTLPLVQVAPV